MTLLQNGTFFHVLAFMESEEAPGLLFALLKRQIISFSSAHWDDGREGLDGKWVRCW